MAGGRGPRKDTEKHGREWWGSVENRARTRTQPLAAVLVLVLEHQRLRWGPNHGFLEYRFAEYEYCCAEYEYRCAEYEYRFAEYEYRCAEVREGGEALSPLACR